MRLNESLRAPISSSPPGSRRAATKSPRRTACAASVRRRSGRTMARASASARSATTAPTRSALTPAWWVICASGSASLAAGSKTTSVQGLTLSGA